MALGFLGLSYQSEVLPYQDETTPVALTGVKMLPILQLENGKNMNESLDIIKTLDSSNLLKSELMQTELGTQLEQFLDRVSKPVHNLCMPYWVWTPEFSPESRAYFEAKKSKKRGPFRQLAQSRAEFEAELPPLLEEAMSFLSRSSEVDILDIAVAAQIWGLYVLPEFQFPPKLHARLQTIKSRCHFDYHRDFWTSSL
jgi:glutaredoxin 2